MQRVQDYRPTCQILVSQLNPSLAVPVLFPIVARRVEHDTISVDDGYGHFRTKAQCVLPKQETVGHIELAYRRFGS